MIPYSKNKAKGITHGVTDGVTDGITDGLPLPPVFNAPNPPVTLQPVQMNPIPMLPPTVQFNPPPPDQVRPYNPCDFGLCRTEPTNEQQRHGITNQDVGFINTLAKGGGGDYWQGLMAAERQPVTANLLAMQETNDRLALNNTLNSPAYNQRVQDLLAKTGDMQQAQYLALAELTSPAFMTRLPSLVQGYDAAAKGATDLANNRAALTNTDAAISLPGIASTVAQGNNGMFNYNLNGQTFGVPADNLTVGDVQQGIGNFNQPLSAALADRAKAADQGAKQQTALINQMGADYRANVGYQQSMDKANLDAIAAQQQLAADMAAKQAQMNADAAKLQYQQRGTIDNETFKAQNAQQLEVQKAQAQAALEKQKSDLRRQEERLKAWYKAKEKQQETSAFTSSPPANSPIPKAGEMR